MNTGTVKFFDETKGFGFIKDDEAGKDYFVHSSGLINRITDGDKVEFELREGKRGLNAVNVKVV
ncbi:MAG: cold shock domain-containing protein [Flavobacteriales bacterium]|nr:cold shock domain-containing protein [Flavobacteriales bacterium]